jgi:hypothetical protein
MPQRIYEIPYFFICRNTVKEVVFLLLRVLSFPTHKA